MSQNGNLHEKIIKFWHINRQATFTRNRLKRMKWNSKAKHVGSHKTSHNKSSEHVQLISDFDWHTNWNFGKIEFLAKAQRFPGIARDTGYDSLTFNVDVRVTLLCTVFMPKNSLNILISDVKSVHECRTSLFSHLTSRAIYCLPILLEEQPRSVDLSTRLSSSRVIR